MRILHVADIHFCSGWLEWVSQQSVHYDVLALAGDLLQMLPTENTPLPKQAKIVRDWLGTLPKPAIVCTGNHDIWPGNPLVTTDVWAEGGWLQLCKRTGLVVDGQVADIGGERFAAVKWGHADWPDGTNVVVVHAPPSEARVALNADGMDLGDFEVAMRMCETHPRFVLSGHVHHAAAWVSFDGASYCFNPGCDMKAPVPNHIIIDTEKKTACWHSERKGCVTKRLTE